MPFRSVAILGLGLMGGSLARALKALPEPPRVVGFSPVASEREAAVTAAAVDRCARSAEEVAAEGELVVYATPLGAALELLQRHRGVWLPGAVISDVCGLKAPVAARVRDLGIDRRWVGAHPMTGAEASGFEASRTGLYRDALVWLSSGAAPREVRGRLEAFWTALGARTGWMDPLEHDARMVRTSHVPQLVSNALARCLEAAGLSPGDLGPGGRDMTRLAGSSPTLWRDILAHAPPALAGALEEVGASLGELARALEAGDLDAVTVLMERTRAWSAGEGAAGPLPPAAGMGGER